MSIKDEIDKLVSKLLNRSSQEERTTKKSIKDEIYKRVNKDEINKLVNEELARLKDEDEKAAQEAEKTAQEEKQRREEEEQKFAPMRKVVEEICASVDSKYARCYLALTSAHVEVGYTVEGLDYDNESTESLISWSKEHSRAYQGWGCSSGWIATDIYHINRDDDFDPVDGKIVKRFTVSSQNDRYEHSEDKSEYSDWGFLDESEVAQFLIARISKDIARLKHEGKP